MYTIAALLAVIGLLAYFVTPGAVLGAMGIAVWHVLNKMVV